MSEMIERVARAIHVVALKLEEDQEGKPSGWDDEHPEEKRRMKKYARAAIAAMRDPTQAMCDFGNANMKKDGKDWSREARDSWRGMIDAVLK